MEKNVYNYGMAKLTKREKLLFKILIRSELNNKKVTLKVLDAAMIN